MRSRSVNGAGELTGTIAVYDDDEGFLWEDVVNLSKARLREALITELADRAQVSKDRAREAVHQLMEDQRATHLDAVDTAGPKRERKADVLVTSFISENVELFHDQNLEPHAAISSRTRRAIFRLRSGMFRDQLARYSYSVLGEVPSSETVRSAINTMAGIAMFSSPMHRLHVRTAWYDDALFYDLGDNRAVKITSGGWVLDDKPPILFRRFPQQKVQVEPLGGGDLQDILRFINMPDADMQILYVTDLAASLVPEIPRPVAIVHGPHGSAKSSALRYKRELMDPVEVPLQGAPRDQAEFVQVSSHNLCTFLDNLSSMPAWLSDALSRLCTGDGFIKRSLYTDDDDFVYKPQGVGGITGINLVVTAPDLLDRSFIYQLERISERDRRPEKELNAEFDSLKPKLLGAMFDALAGAMTVKDGIRPRKLPRLADYAIWGCAVAVSIGYTEAEYWAAIEANSRIQTTEALDASPIAQAVCALMADKESWTSTPSELLTALNTVAKASGIDTTAKAWPKDAGSVTRRLNLVVPNLAQVGITFRSEGEGNQRRVTITSSENVYMASVVSAPSFATLTACTSLTSNPLPLTQRGEIIFPWRLRNEKRRAAIAPREKSRRECIYDNHS